MSDDSVVTAEKLERYTELRNRMPRADGPAFLEQDAAVARYWPRLAVDFPSYQFCLLDEETGETAAIANSIPLAFSGEWSDLPAEGLDWVVAKGFEDRSSGEVPRILSALHIEIADGRRGRHLSSQALAVMRRMAQSQGFSHLIAPVRPSLKSRYPLIPIEDYVHWRNPDGLPFDPWLRVHIRAGAEILHVCPRAMRVEGTAEQWKEWIGMDFPSDGRYVIPHGLVPVKIQDGRGEYVEPGIWVLHRLQERTR